MHPLGSESDFDQKSWGWMEVLVREFWEITRNVSTAYCEVVMTCVGLGSVSVLLDSVRIEEIG